MVCFPKFKQSLFLHLLIIALSFNIASAIPLDTPTPPLATKEWKMLAAQNAFDIGLFQLAYRLYSEILQEETNPNNQQTITLQLASILINQSKYSEAISTLNALPNKTTPTALLLTAIAYLSTNHELSKKIIDQLNPQQIPPNYLPWLSITKGLIAENNQNFKEAKNFFQEAHSLTSSNDLKTHIDTLLFRIEIFSGKVSESLEKNLERKLEKTKKKPSPSLIKQYAIVLDKLNQKEKALNILQSLLQDLPSKEKNETDSINLLIAFIATPETQTGRQALEKIIENAQNPELSNIALTTLTHHTNHTSAKSFIQFLTSLINATKLHPFMDSLLLHRAHLAIFLEQNDLAQSDASRLLEEFPASPHIPQALRILAYSSWTNTPPHYRTAADFLSKLSEKTKDPNERTQLTALVADSYFLNQDYPIAAKIYASLLEDPQSHLPKGPILYQLILSLINLNDTKNAENYLEKFRQNPSIDPSNLWRAEWTLINSFKNQGEINRAFSLIRKLRLPPSTQTISLDLKLRLIWLHAQLSLESGNPEASLPLIDSLLTLIHSSNPEILAPDQANLIASHALLLKSQALLQLNKQEEALTTISTLRNNYPNSKPTTLSYLTEARYFSSINNPTKAQQDLINLADNFPNSDYAPIALYEAALNAESRSLKNTYQEALAILERLISSYPQNPLTYNARFKQADILRKLGNFSDAQLIYENIIKQFPHHPAKYHTKLAFIDSLFAQSSNNPHSLCEIASEYYQLLDLPSLSPNLRAEAGFKSGFAYIKAAQPEKAQNAFWLTISTLLIPSPSNSTLLNEQGKYWVARSIFELASLLELSANNKEANAVYQLILSHQLPGTALANSKIK